MSGSRKSKKGDINQNAFRVMRELSGQVPQDSESSKAIAGRKGGERGGKARAKKLTPAQRSAMAKWAANKRWGNTDD